ncbi:MAG: DUF4190 domain-containing protein [Clostridia bacterium]|nr:DUF4190 domain-containing protein [Clostridia bacterium]
MEQNNFGQNYPVLKLSALAIAGMVLGIVGMIFSFYGVVPVLAIVFSGIALKQINEGKYKGKGFAITGLVLGIVGAAWTVLTLTICSATLAALGAL